MIPWLVWLALRVFVFVARKPHCTFTDPVTKAPYMTRWWLGPRKVWPDAEGRTGGQGWYLHCFHRSDWSRDLHCHPAELGVSLMLRGGYTEARREGASSDEQRGVFGPGAVNVLTESTFHRVTLFTISNVRRYPIPHIERTEIPAWTLFYIGKRAGRSWGFLRGDGSIDKAPHFDGRTGETVER